MINLPLSKVPAVVQNDIPFSINDSYFEVELLNPSHLYKTLSIGACPRISSGSATGIPGEVDSSVGFIPLNGLIMRSKEIASYASEHIVHCAASSSEGLLVGVGIRYLPTQHVHSHGSCLFFFTINRQEVRQMVHSMPCGLYPTLAFAYQSSPSPTVTRDSQCKVCKLQFPKPWPFCDTQISPWGIARMSQNFSIFGSTYICDDTEDAINAIQACIPVSPNPSHFKVTVVNGGMNFGISIGLATPMYSLDQHVGMQFPSIGYHVGTGSLFHNGVSSIVSPKYTHVGVTVGCCVVFPDDGSRANAQVYFTVDGVIVACRIVAVPLCGFYPSIAMHTCGGLLVIDLSCRVPFPNLKFSESWHLLHNMVCSDSKLQVMSLTDYGLAQLDQVVSKNKTSYVTFSCSNSWKSGRVLIGFSNSSDSPMSSSVAGMNRSIYLDIFYETVLLIRNGYRQSDDCYNVTFGKIRKESVYGCGIKCFPNLPLALLFFTLNNQVVYTQAINLDVQLRPSICLMGTSGKVEVNTCAKWPPFTSIGSNWGRYQNMKLIDGHFLTFDSESLNRSKIGFAQASSPLHFGWSYFEIEVVCRDPKKAIAVGLASNSYDMNNWIGWKKDSIAYHADDGRLFASSGLGINFGPKLYQGDIVGCGVKFLDREYVMSGSMKIEVFFTVNRSVVGDPRTIMVPPGGLFPTVCVESCTEVVSMLFDAKYPSSLDKMSKNWVRSVCVAQSGNLIQHEFKSRFSSGKVSIGYCQASRPFSVQRQYFEVEIMDCEMNTGDFSIGLAPLQPENATDIVTDSVLVCARGQVIIKRSISSYPVIASSFQQFQVRDRMGCKLDFDSGGNQPKSITFTRNGVAVASLPIPSELALAVPLLPTIYLPNRKDSVMVMLNAPFPKLLPQNLLGWLRTERIQINGNVVNYSEESHGSVGAGQIYSALCRKNSYYEIEVLDLGERSCLSIGAASVDYPLTKQPGWKANSVGCHGDDGSFFNASGKGYRFGPQWRVGDIIGLGVRPYEGDVLPGRDVQVYITINGIEIGHATVNVPQGGFFPTIGFHSKNEKVKVDIDCGQGYLAFSAKKKWRTLCGIDLQRDPLKACTILKHLALVSRTLPDYNIAFGLAIAYNPFSSDMQYFEVEILRYGESRRIAVGVASKNYTPNIVLGWNQNSISYHTDTGCLHNASMQGKSFGPTACIGDTIGCGLIIDSCNTDVCSIFFTVNGSTIGHQVKCSIPAGGYFPAIGLFSPNDSVSVSLAKSYKPSVLTDCLVGLMRIHNCSYSDNVLAFGGSNVRGPANAHFAVSLNSSRNYFSVSLLNLNDNILVGLVSKDYPVTQTPGEQSFSIAYNVLAGTVQSQVGNETKKMVAVKCQPGDVVGCGIFSSDESKSAKFTFFFVVNKKIVHQSKISKVPSSVVDWFPAVGFLPVTKSSSVYLNWNYPLFEYQNTL